MSRNYDNWERLVAAVIKKQQIWELCHQDSIATSICSEYSSPSDLSSTFRLSNFESDLSSSFFGSDQKRIPKLLAIEGAWRRPLVMGKGRFGTSSLIELKQDIVFSDQHSFSKGTRLVMKKLAGQVIVTEEEFRAAFGKCRHQNIATPRAYYFSNHDGNYCIFNDYSIHGSLHDMLQARRAYYLSKDGNFILNDEYLYCDSIITLNAKMHIGYPNWDIRLKIAIGVARGVAHIHSRNMAHGNLTSSNIFVNSDLYGCVSDFGLAGIMRVPEEQVDLSYHASEYEFKNASQESDVYSFGVVLLELVTGRTSIGLIKWAFSVAPQDWSSKLFDKRTEWLYNPGILCDELDMEQFLEKVSIRGHYSANMYEYHERLTPHLELIKVEMAEVFQIANNCLAKLPQDRPKMFQVVSMLENIASLHSENHLVSEPPVPVRNSRFRFLKRLGITSS